MPAAEVQEVLTVCRENTEKSSDSNMRPEWRFNSRNCGGRQKDSILKYCCILLRSARMNLPPHRFAVVLELEQCKTLVVVPIHDGRCQLDDLICISCTHQEGCMPVGQGGRSINA